MIRRRDLAAALVVGLMASSSPAAAGEVGTPELTGPIISVPKASPTATPSPEATPTPEPSPSSTSPSPSPSAAPPEEGIELLAPGTAYLPQGELPKIGDAYDGVDETFHITAVSSETDDASIVEVSLAASDRDIPPVPGPVDPLPGQEGPEYDVGLMQRVPDLDELWKPDLWELDADVPDGIPDGPATLIVRVYDFTSEGFVERMSDTMAVSIENRPSSPPVDNDNPASTLELSWPTVGGNLGFYRSTAQNGSPLSSATVWATVVDGTASSSATGLNILYSVDPVDGLTRFTSCGSAFTFKDLGDGSKSFSGICELKGFDLPSQVTAIAAIPTGTGTTSTSNGAADVHPVIPYIQNTREMSLTLEPAALARGLPRQCLPFVGAVRDQFDRPVPSANVDIHFSGPTDEAGFGSRTASTAGAFASFTADGSAPNTGHSKRFRHVCDSDASSGALEGWHRVVGASDTAHIEMNAKAGFDPPGIGTFKFEVFSADPGVGHLLGWIDDEPMTSDGASRLPDTDELEDGEPTAEHAAHWYEQQVDVTLIRDADAMRPGGCSTFAFEVRGKSAPVDGVNVDVHVTGPDEGVAFCDPPGASPRRAPDAGEHEAHGPADGKDEDGPTLHTEGETDGDGNFVFGVTSPSSGDSQVVAWVDGEPDSPISTGDDDVLATGELTAESTQTWALTSGEANVRLLSPAALQDGVAPTISNRADLDSTYGLVAQVDAPELVPEIEFSYAPQDSEQFVTIKKAARVPGTDVYEANWDTGSLAPGSYRIRASIPDGGSTEQSITIDNGKSAAAVTNPPDVSFVTFDDGATTIGGAVSAGADRVDLYYTTSRMNGAGSTTRWKKCGEVALASNDAAQRFSGSCSLQDRDQPYQVVAVATAATAAVCDPVGCSFQTHASGIHRVVGRVARPRVDLTPTESEDLVGRCMKLVAHVTDEAGSTLAQVPVDASIDAGDGASFCDLSGDGEPSGSNVARSSEGAHIEGRTDRGGRFVFGVRGHERGELTVSAWVDQSEDDVQAQDEPWDGSLVHLILPGHCTQIGTKGADVLVGTDARDRLCGLGGGDTLKGLHGDDVLIGGPGRDVLRGGPGNDQLVGGAGMDLCIPDRKRSARRC